MIEIATIKAIMDLFKDLVGLIDQSEKKKRDKFERVVTPIYSKLEPVAKEYYELLEFCRKAVFSEKPDFAAAAKEASEKRSALVIARNSVLGEASIFAYPSYEQLEKFSPWNAQMYRFSHSIFRYFIVERDIFDIGYGSCATEIIKGMKDYMKYLEKG